MIMYPYILTHAICNLAINSNEYFFCIHDSKNDDSASKCYIFSEYGHLLYTVVNCTHVNDNVDNELAYVGNIPRQALESGGSQNLGTYNHLKVMTLAILGYPCWSNM
jgi:hypothetical protein